jgi:hypothetical protein
VWALGEGEIGRIETGGRPWTVPDGVTRGGKAGSKAGQECWVVSGWASMINDSPGLAEIEGIRETPFTLGQE